MKFSTLALVAFAGSLASNLSAQSATVVANGSAKVTQSSACNPSGCEGKQTTSISGVHAFEISADQFNRIDANTSVTVSILGTATTNLRIGDDPNYQPGDTSAVVNSSAIVVSTALPMEARMTWSNGVFQVQLKCKATTTVNSNAQPLKLTLADSGGVRDLEPAPPLGNFPYTTSLEDGGGIFATSTGWVAAQVLQTTKATPGPNASVKVAVTVSLKAKYMTVDPD